MIENSQDVDLPVDYVVFDSWYAHPGLIRRISEHLPVVCMVKNHPNYLYRLGKRTYNLQTLYQKVAARKQSNPEGQIILLEIMMILTKTRNPHAIETACAICGVIEQFSKKIYDNSMTF